HRLLAALSVAVTFLACVPAPVRADILSEEILSGGAPRGRFSGSLFGGSSPIARTTVNFASADPPGTIIINTSERRLYRGFGTGRAIRCGLGVGRVGSAGGGVPGVVSRREWPAWTPPSQMLRRRPDLPRHMRGGPENPLGARAMYLGSPLFRIHGSNEP